MSIPAAIAPAINGNETSSITKSVFDFLIYFIYLIL